MAGFWSVRSLGGCQDAMLVASGRADCWIEMNAAAWDLAPLKVIAEEAGAVFFNFDGGRALPGGKCVICVAPPEAGPPAFLARGQYHALVFLLVAALGGMLLNNLLKPFFGRARPDIALRLTEVTSLSFPSGHAMGSAVIYFTLAALLARLVEPRALKLYFLGLAALLSFLVGASRVYLGVHYPSDVLAGWTVGLAWALLCWTVARYLQVRGSVEPEK